MGRIVFALFLGRIDGEFLEEVFIHPADQVFFLAESLMADLVDLVNHLFDVVGSQVSGGEGALNEAALQLFAAGRDAVQSRIQRDVQLRRRCVDDGGPTGLRRQVIGSVCKGGVVEKGSSDSQTVTLKTIPRTSSISMPATTMGSANNITITRASSSFTHTPTYSFGSATGTIATKTSSTSVSWTPPTSLATQIPNSTYAKSTISFSYWSCSGKNTLTTAVSYKKSTDSSYTNAGVTFSSGTQFIFGGGNLSVDYSYDIRFTLTDAFGTVTVVDSLSTASVLMDFKAGGTGLAVGKVSETDNCFEVAENWDVKVYGMLLEEFLRRKPAGGLIYATCDTAVDEQDKVVTATGSFTLTAGTFVAVKFTNSNSASQPRLNINGTGAKYIVTYNNYVPQTYAWKPMRTVLFIFDGTYFVGFTLTYATTGYYGVTKLSNSTASTSTTLAATANAVKLAYDRNSWDSITLTNPLALAYGGTGATSAAAARTNLGLGITLLYSGTVTTGSCTFNYGSYNWYIIIGQPASTGSRTPIVVPRAALTTSAVAYQITDESYYYSFNLSYSGSTVTPAYKARNSSGQIIAVYGVN